MKPNQVKLPQGRELPPGLVLRFGIQFAGSDFCGVVTARGRFSRYEEFGKPRRAYKKQMELWMCQPVSLRNVVLFGLPEETRPG